MHPRSTDCILGGTLDEGSWDTEPDPAQTTAILQRCTDIAQGLPTPRSSRASRGCDQDGRRFGWSWTRT